MHTVSSHSRGSRLRFLIEEARSALNERELPKGKTLHIQLGNWGGVRSIPKKQIRDFQADLKAMRADGFSLRDKTAQIKKKDFDKFEKIVKKYKLRIDGIRAAKYLIYGFDEP